MARARQPRAASASGRAGKAKSTKNGGKAAAGSATAVVSVSPQAGALTAGVQSRQRTQRKGSKASATTASSVSPFNDHGVTPEAHAASKTVVLTKSSQPHLSSAHIMGPQLPAIRQSDNTVVSQSSSPILPILPSPPPLTAPSTPSLNVASSTPRSKDDAGDAIASTGRKASSVHTQRTASLSSASALANAAAAAASLPPAWPTERSAESSAPFTTGEHMTRLEEVADMRRALQLLTRHEQLEELDHECTHLEELRAAIKHQLHGLALEAVTLDRVLESKLSSYGIPHNKGAAGGGASLIPATDGGASLGPCAADIAAAAAAAAAVVAAASATSSPCAMGSAGTPAMENEAEGDLQWLSPTEILDPAHEESGDPTGSASPPNSNDLEFVDTDESDDELVSTFEAYRK